MQWRPPGRTLSLGEQPLADSHVPCWPGPGGASRTFHSGWVMILFLGFGAELHRGLGLAQGGVQ